jgi:nucleoside-diphosphate-sugar epimerase
MAVLITGGAGYVGTSLVPLLLRRGARVRVMDSLRHGGQALIPYGRSPRFEFVRGDIRDPGLLAQALESVDTVVHLAAVVGAPSCDADPELAASINVDGTRSLLAARRSDQRLILASTGSVYGRVPSGRCTEQTPPGPISVYARTKAAAEALVRAAGNAVVLRYATAFGVSGRMRFDLLPNDFTYRAVRQGTLTVYEESHRRSFLHVHDIARAIMVVLDHWAEVRDRVFNVGSDDLQCTKGELARRIQTLVDYDLRFGRVGHDPDHRDYLMDCSAFGRVGFRPTVDLDSGVRELVRVCHLIDVPGLAQPGR